MGKVIYGWFRTLEAEQKTDSEHSAAVAEDTGHVRTVTGKKIPMHEAYQIIRRGKFVGWGRL